MSYLNVEEVESALLVATSAPFSTFTQLIILPNRTWEDRQCHAIRIGNGSSSIRPTVYLLGGVHAREWGSSDILINFVEQLEQAYLAGTGLTFGTRIFSSDDIRGIVDNLDIIVFPQANPDGRSHSMTQDTMWRKNRRIRHPNSNSGNCVGVDLNRNYDFLWDFSTHFHPNAGVTTTADPCDYQNYHGPSAFSEPETRNVKWIFDSFPNIQFFIDLHSYGESILHNWGDDDNQITDPTMNFQNPTYNGLRGIPDASGLDGASDYKEYIPSHDLSTAITLANTFRDGIKAVRGTSYNVKPSVTLYPTSGASDDYAYSRSFIHDRKTTVIAYTLEWGTVFQPACNEMREIIREITAGLLAFCLWIRNRLLRMISLDEIFRRHNITRPVSIRNLAQRLGFQPPISVRRVVDKLT
jgi:carboxypeptidase T